MAALGLPFVLVLGAGAELVAGIVRGSHLAPFRDLWKDLRRMRKGGEAATWVELLGSAAGLAGAGLVGAAAVGAGPGTLPLLYLSLVVAAAGGHLVASESPTRRGSGFVRGRLLDAGLAEPVVAASLAALFIRWRAESLRHIWGAQEVVGGAYEVGPLLATIGTTLAILALVGVTAVRAAPGPEPRRGRARRAAGGATLLRIVRWAMVGAPVSLVPALLAGLDLTAASPDLDLLVWVGTAIGAVGLTGAAWGAGDRLPPWARRGVVLPVHVVLAAGAVVLMVAA